ncbi:MAG: DUF3775 domain-containing protein [Paracoccaceae bacterium]|nr:DUF3775 domain-containing protein [Paracoccaceae bacterium]
MIELPFDTAEIQELILRIKSVMAQEEMDIPDLGGNASDDEVSEMLQETEGDLSRDEIRQEIESMNEEQQDALVALFWLGRGDTDVDGWDAAVALAHQNHTGGVTDYLLGEPLVATYLADGIDALEESGALDPD